MRFIATLFLVAFSSAHASSSNGLAGTKMKLSPNHKLPESINVNSDLGRKIMSNARRLEEQEQEDEQEEEQEDSSEEDEDVDLSWVENYSIKFQGCHHISKWNEEADEDDDGEDNNEQVRIATRRLVRFRLCPTNYCSLEYTGGCKNDYGDYVINMDYFLEAYVDSIEEYKETKCEYIENNCVCDDFDDDGENCLYNCYKQKGMEQICVDEEDEFEIAEYAYCSEANLDNNNNNRQLEDAEEEKYYIGPYCAEQGGAIYLGMFIDDTCTDYADEYGGRAKYYEMSGRELPFGGSNMVSMDCFSCQANDNDGDDDDNNINEMCEQVYEKAGKCEANLEQYEQDNNACAYIVGVQVIQKDGIVASNNKPNTVAMGFIGLLSAVFVSLAMYVIYLKERINNYHSNLEEQTTD